MTEKKNKQAKSGSEKDKEKAKKSSRAKLEKELAEARAKIDELTDKLLRAHAEMDNLRKRTQRQIEDAHKYAIEKFVVALLEVFDNLERALEAEPGNEEAMREGVRMTLKQWHEVMKRFAIERIDALGKPFDPHLHEALSQMPSDEPEGTVVAQHVAGYTLNGRLIRPARVLVSSGPASAKEKEDAPSGNGPDEA